MASSGTRGWFGSFAVAAAFYLYNGFLTHVPLYWVRHLYLRRVLGIRLGRGAAVHMRCFITGKRISVGDRSVINRGCYLDGRAGLSIGEDVSVSPEAYLVSLSHDPNSPTFDTLGRPVTIGARAWIGARAMVLPGVTVGEGAVVGAGSVVSRSCGPFEIVAGVPARRIGERNRGLTYSLGYFPFFDTDIMPG
jgi:acetyltransferase-like isoleucine patch superfamily enzyme